MSKTLPNISTHFADWYNDVVYKAELVDLGPVRGTMVIRPYGYALWNNIKLVVNKKIVDQGAQNAAFPLFIPLSFFQKEAEHVKGFAPELAIVTHAGGKELEEPVVVRPTSETVIHSMFAKWIQSWRDLPLKINQWANVVRWELRTRPFLRTTEFFWQEGHTAHETAQEADQMAKNMLDEYYDTITNFLAIPAIKGIKSESEKFAGADTTLTIEALMPDGKALQMCTSHVISQNFAKAFDMKFQDREGKLAYPHLTSWGFTTRSVGAAVMVHGDQKGLVLPPRVAPIQAVIIPIFKKGADTKEIIKAATKVKDELAADGIRVHLDDDEHRTPGTKFYEWELKGVPLRLEIGPRDVAAGHAMVADRLGLKKEPVPFATIVTYIKDRLHEMQHALYEKANDRFKAMMHTGEKLTVFGKELADTGGFWHTGWCGNTECEKQLKEHKATIRCLLESTEFKSCFNCDGKSTSDVLVAKAY